MCNNSSILAKEKIRILLTDFLNNEPFVSLEETIKISHEITEEITKNMSDMMLINISKNMDNITARCMLHDYRIAKGLIPKDTPMNFEFIN